MKSFVQCIVINYLLCSVVIYFSDVGLLVLLKYPLLIMPPLYVTSSLLSVEFLLLTYYVVGVYAV